MSVLRWAALALPPSLALVIFTVVHLLPTTIPLYFELAPTTAPQSSNPTQFSLLIGILTSADLYERRRFLRLIYGTQSSSIANIHVKFLFCRLTKEEQHVLVALEVLRFNDIIVLNCSENIDSGKTYSYLSSLPDILPQQYDYVMKADDDVFIRLEPLAASLKLLSRTDLYYGFVIPCGSTDPYEKSSYMSGMRFVLSWDLVEWIASSEMAASDVVGPEDKVVGRWLEVGRKGMNRFTEKPGMYDYPGTNGRCSHEPIPETVAVHRLKRWEQWLDVLRYFNVTKGLESSNLYHMGHSD